MYITEYQKKESNAKGSTVLRMSGLLLLVVGMVFEPFVAAQQEQQATCLQDVECAAMVTELQQAFVGYDKEIRKLTRYEQQLQFMYNKKKKLLAQATSTEIEQELAALTAALTESKDWNNAFAADMQTAAANYDKDELEDLLYAVGDINEPISKAYSHVHKLRKLLS